MLVSYCPFPLVLGRPDAPPLQSSGVAVATASLAGRDLPPVSCIPVRYYDIQDCVAGLPDTLPAGADGAIVPLAVAAAMRAGGHRRPYRIFTPDLFKEEAGVRYVPGLLYHDYLLTEQPEPW